MCLRAHWIHCWWHELKVHHHHKLLSLLLDKVTFGVSRYWSRNSIHIPWKSIYLSFNAWSLHGSLWGRRRNTLVNTNLVRVPAAWLSRGSRSTHWIKFKNWVKDHDCFLILAGLQCSVQITWKYSKVLVYFIINHNSVLSQPFWYSYHITHSTSVGINIPSYHLYHYKLVK